jgi:hypothetical protein
MHIVHDKASLPHRAKVQNFASEEDRERLSPAALVAVGKLAKTWSLTRDETAGLLALSPSKWDRILGGDQPHALNQDQLTRASALIGIFKGLHLLFADTMADRWPRLRNAGPLFNDRTPIEAMTEGGIPVMMDVRRYIDALRGGL